MLRLLHVIGFFISIAVLTEVYGQKLFTASARAEVKAMFGSKPKDLWIHTLHGYLDKTHEIEMILGTDGVLCKGMYILKTSGTVFYVEGEDIDNNIKLYEYNKKGRHTGYISGNYDGKKMESVWYDIDRNMHVTMSLYQSDLLDEGDINPCNSKHWYRWYRSKEDSTELTVNLIKNEQVYQITVFRKNKNDFSDVFVSEELTDKSLNVALKEGDLELMIPDFKSNILLVRPYGSADNFTTLEKFHEAAFDCYTYCDFTTRILLRKPVINHKKFNDFMAGEFSKWKSESEKQIHYQNAEESSIDERWIKSGQAWVELDYITEDIISGTIYKQSSWKRGTEKKCFIYDLKLSKNLQPKDIFWDINSFYEVKTGAQKQYIKNLPSMDPEISSWLSDQNFDHLTLKKDGFSFQTPHSMIYGEYKFFLSFASLNGMIKHKSIAKLITTDLKQ